MSPRVFALFPNGTRKFHGAPPPPPPLVPVFCSFVPPPGSGFGQKKVFFFFFHQISLFPENRRTRGPVRPPCKAPNQYDVTTQTYQPPNPLPPPGDGLGAARSGGPPGGGLGSCVFGARPHPPLRSPLWEKWENVPRFTHPNPLLFYFLFPLAPEKSNLSPPPQFSNSRRPQLF